MSRHMSQARKWMSRSLVGGAALLAAAGAFTASAAGTTPATPQPPHAAAARQDTDRPLPGFRDGYATNGEIRIHYVVGGHGPALFLLHGWPETWHAWAKVAPALARDHTVVAVDLRGLGRSAPAATDPGNYTSLALATDIHAVAEHLGFDRIDLAGHDWGGQIALAYAARYRTQVRHLAILEAPPTSDYLDLVKQLPNVLWWDAFINGPKGRTAERLVAGRERTFYSAVYGDGPGGTISREDAKRYIAAYSRPGSTHAGFEYFRQQDQGVAEVDRLFARDGKLTIPVLGAGGRYSMGSLVGKQLPRVATNVTPAVVPNANHWVLEENPSYVRDLLVRFLER